MTRWIIRTVIVFCALTMLSVVALLLLGLEVIHTSVLFTLLLLSALTFVAFAILISAAMWRNWRNRSSRLD